ncbi:hypothetical protein [Tautonia sociabilis]|uniref:Uncharacterized protein n=1 Tax=Tautonia sociabilis TaxID=2080755 RepID=A0A432MH65_9BACT|nr:hypothetical protein [Tautonia sociabilis]RUL86121.1 hypothetical protein TsocGM_17045 [Tautonia sociabilis]
MGFLDLLHGARGRASTLDERSRANLLRAWGLDESDLEERTPEDAGEKNPLDYDRSQWGRKLRHILDGLPDSESRWEHLIQEGRAKRFDEDWMRGLMRDEFAMMVRRAVADRVFTDRERQKLDRARTLIGLDEDEARAISSSVVREAESFFGEQVEGT